MEGDKILQFTRLVLGFIKFKILPREYYSRKPKEREEMKQCLIFLKEINLVYFNQEIKLL